jgi:dUTP pyrophosphatase
VEIRFKKLIPEAKMPTKKYKPDAGFDFYCTSITENSDYTEYHTGIALEIPDGYVGLAFPRSSVTEKDLMLKNSVGVIDATYRGEIVFRFAKVVHELLFDDEFVERKFPFFGKEKVIKRTNIINMLLWISRHLKKYEVGDRVGQIVFMELPKITLIEAEELSETERGSQGFGHTGK